MWRRPERGAPRARCHGSEVVGARRPAHAVGLAARSQDAEQQGAREQMAVPKKKTSKSKSRSRRASAWTLSAPPRSTCPRCRQAKLPHVVCPNCGFYKGRVAIDVG